MNTSIEQVCLCKKYSNDRCLGKHALHAEDHRTHACSCSVYTQGHIHRYTHACTLTHSLTHHHTHVHFLSLSLSLSLSLAPPTHIHAHVQASVYVPICVHTHSLSHKSVHVFQEHQHNVHACMYVSMHVCIHA